MSSALHQIHEIIQLPKAKEQEPSHPDASWSPELYQNKSFLTEEEL